MANAQSWMASYEKGLQAAREGNWGAARAAFQEAIAMRPDDTGGATRLPGPVTERRQWRNGAAYSPNFLAAYSEYRIGLASATPEDAKPHFQTAASEFEALIAKGQTSRGAFFFLSQIYQKTGDTAKRLDVEARYAAAKPNFRVDTEIVAPEEVALMNGVAGTQGTGPSVTVIRPGQNPTTQPGGTNPPVGGTPAVGPVSPISTKFALIVGNSTAQGSGALAFAADDAQAVREALLAHAGYMESNVDLVLNTTRDQLMQSVKALAERVPEDGTVFIFFAGTGMNSEGKDYLGMVDSGADAGSMVRKSDLYQPFIAKGARIFAFFEVPRTITSGNYFGKEVPLVGSIAQVQATIPGESVASEVRGGKEMGIFARAIVSALQDIRSNRIPILEFGWQVFDRARGGGTSGAGGGARQVPTLPVLTHMSPAERF